MTNNTKQTNNDWGSYAIITLIIAVLGLILSFIALPQGQDFLSQFAAPTPLESAPFDDNEIGVVVANFTNLDAGAREIESWILDELEASDVSFIRVGHTIADRAEAQSIARLYNATITIWGESADAGIQVFYEVTPRDDSEINTRIDRIAVSADLENFNTYILEGADTVYMIRFIEGQIAYFHGDYETALSLFDDAIIRIPSGREEEIAAVSLYVLSGNTHRYLGQYDEAIADYDRAIELNDEAASAYFNRGTVYQLLEQYEQAIVDYTLAIELDSEIIYTYSNRGSAYYRTGQYEQAIADYTHAIELGNESAIVYFARGLSYKQSRLYEQAIADYTGAIELDSEYVTAYHSRGTVYELLEQYEDAVADFTRAIELDNTYENAYWGRGNAYYDLGSDYYEDAIADYQQYAELSGAFEPFMETRIAEMQAALGN